VGAWLSSRGTAAALLVGAAVTVGAGPRGLLVLAVFFVSSSLLTPGGGRRDAVQVLANGGIAAVAALLSAHQPAWRLAFAGALAAAAADTWSTELGARSRSRPRLITTGELVEPGSSGGVTVLGTAGGALGALTVSAAGLLAGLVSLPQALWVAAAGTAGGVADSILGATVQARYRCAACGAVLEQRRHGCPDGAGRLESGHRWITNDAVNLLATLTGAALAAGPIVLRLAGLE
jgi:uncharacterized protein (TIGR00297 family)